MGDAAHAMVPFYGQGMNAVRAKKKKKTLYIKRLIFFFFFVQIYY